ncbi:hypothetical protein [Pedobacter sp. FW305-3-2-15-E-R2A2]|uniref:hypothetical protein n=1 Tax=Pedobacter sp. FW305-3-2-15-E-R2A2 TaxID=3140251 RepID=UPI00314006E0
MAIHLQDPFENKPTDTPTTTICRTIERDLKQMLKESHKHDEDLKEKSALKASNIFYIL